jgi:hypothetical protein
MSWTCLSSLIATVIRPIDAITADMYLFLFHLDTPLTSLLLFSTITETVTTGTVTVSRVESVPTYATMCTNDPALYRSACLCNSVVPSTVTAATPTVVVIEKVAATTVVEAINYQGV